MEEATRPRGFSITTGKIPILLSLKRADGLKPHEETVREDLNGIVNALQHDPVLRHPIIADSASGAVLDGTHRLAALKQLNCITIPVALIDYQNPLVRVDRWFRIFNGQDLQTLLRRTDNLSPIHMSFSEAEESLLGRQSYATLRDAKECYAFKAKDSVALEMSKHAFALEQIAKRDHAKITFTDDAAVKDFAGSGVLMSTIRLEKQEVVESCQKQVLFPPKSTRHLIPSRPLGVSVPLGWLKNSNIGEAEREFEKHLKAMSVRRLPEGSMVGSRRYMEEVFLFE